MSNLIHKFYLNNQYIITDTYSGSIHIVDALAYDIVEDVQCKSEEEIVSLFEDRYPKEEILQAIRELKALKEEGSLFTEPFDPQEIHYNPQSVIKAMCLHVSHDCDLRCKYCFAGQGDFQGDRKLMSVETGKQAIDFLIEHSGNRRNLEIDLFGGEPLMNYKMIQEVVEYGKEQNKVHDKNIRFTLTTNGMQLTEDKMDWINENMSNVVLSLDGRKEINDEMRPTINAKGSYDLIVPKLQEFVRRRGDKDYYIRGTFTSKNLDFTKDALDFYKNGFRKISIEPVVTDPSMDYALREEHLDRILKEYETFSKEYIEINRSNDELLFYHFMIDLGEGPCLAKRTVGCGAGAEYISVTPDGDIYPCHQFVGNPDFLIGTLEKGIQNETLRNSFKEANVFTKDACRQCWAKFYCSGGCHANAFYSNQTIMEPHEVGCTMEKKRLECAISILANLTDTQSV